MTKKITVLVVLLFVLLAGMVTLGITSPSAQADTAPKAVTGWAWSSNIGWIKLNPTGGASDVFYDPATGALPGWAWSSNVGWIKFDPVGPFPSAPLSAAKLPVGDAAGPMTGWIKVYAGDADPSDGWDGWVKMAKGPGDTGGNYGVLRVNGAGGIDHLANFAWGSDVVGWVDFSPSLSGGGNVDCDSNTAGVQTVCIGGMSVVCSATPSSVIIGQTLSWSATPATGGTAPYTYKWSLDNSGSFVDGTAARSLDLSYPSAGTHTARVKVTDSSSNSITVTCDNTVAVTDPSIINCALPMPAGKENCDCDTSSGTWVNCTNICTPGDPGCAATEAKLIIPDTVTNVTKITSQSTGPVASAPSITIENKGNVAISNVRIMSITSASGFYDLANVANVKCRLTKAGSPMEWKSCLGGLSVNLNAGETARFSIQIPEFIQAINTNNPYKIVVKGTAGTPAVDVPLTRVSGTPVDITFEYPVSGQIPQ